MNLPSLHKRIDRLGKAMGKDAEQTLVMSVLHERQSEDEALEAYYASHPEQRGNQQQIIFVTKYA